MKHQVPESMKFKKLQRLLGVPKIIAVGTLELLWISTQKNAPQGDIGRFSNLEIAIECEWEGDPDELVNALVECGWLDADPTYRLIVHDWEEHCPGWLKRQLARHKRSFVTGSSLLTVTPDTQEATPNLTQPNLTQPKEPNGSCTEPKNGSPPTSEEAVLTFPTSGTKKTWHLTNQQLDEWADLFPAVDVLAQCRNALAWIRANDTRRKTANGMKRFLVGWLTKEQNRGGARAGPTNGKQSLAERNAAVLAQFED